MAENPMNENEAAKAIVNKRARDDRDAYSADLTLVDDIARAIRDAVHQARRETWESAARVVEAFNNWARWADGNIKPIPSRERIAAALRAEGKENNEADKS